MVFKFLNDLVPKYLANIFVPRSHIHTRTLKAADCVNSFRRGLLQKLLFRLESNADELIMTTNRII